MIEAKKCKKMLDLPPWYSMLFEKAIKKLILISA